MTTQAKLVHGSLAGVPTIPDHVHRKFVRDEPLTKRDIVDCNRAIREAMAELTRRRISEAMERGATVDEDRGEDD